MTTINQATTIAKQYAASHEAFEPYKPIFIYGLHWVIGRSTTHHILITPMEQIVTIPLGINADIDNQAAQPHREVQPIPDGYKPPF